MSETQSQPADAVDPDLLSARQKLFCLLYARGGNGRAAAEGAGYSPRTARQQASRLLTYADIRETVAELRAEALEQNRIDRAELMARMDFVYLRAMTRGDYNPAIRAVEVQAKICGLLPARLTLAEARLIARAQAELAAESAAAPPAEGPEPCAAETAASEQAEDPAPAAPRPVDGGEGEPRIPAAPHESTAAPETCESRSSKAHGVETGDVARIDDAEPRTPAGRRPEPALADAAALVPLDRTDCARAPLSAALGSLELESRPDPTPAHRGPLPALPHFGGTAAAPHASLRPAVMPGA